MGIRLTQLSTGLKVEAELGKKMTTPSRKLQHIAEASLTVFTKQIRVGMGQNPFFEVLLCFVGFCKVL